MADAWSPKIGQALVRAKKTFLEFKFFPYDTSDRVRRGSAPSRAARLDADEEMWSSEASTEECSDHVLWTSEDLESDFDVDDSDMPKNSLENESNCDNSETEAFLGEDSDRLCCDSTPGCIGSMDADEQVETSQASASEYCDSEYCDSKLATLEFSMRTKNTFLEFRFAAYADSAKKRRVSSPACFESPGINEDMWIAGGRGLHTSEDIASPCNADESLQTSVESFGEESWNAEVDEHMSMSRKSPSKVKRDRMRPCKGKRQRSKKFLLRLCEQIDEDPEGFNISLIEWPQSVVDKEHLLDIVKSHRDEALQQLATKRNKCN